ncbi:MAG: cache domain-containing protein, partial [Anaerolineales bacterium]|nr:cache domain-containing protein [Anaerolineales bacterium]
MKLASLARLFANWSIRAKLIVTFLVITILPLGFLTYLSNQASHQSLTQAANSSLFSLASQTAESIDNFITHELETIQIEAQFPLFQSYFELPTEDRPNSEPERQIQAYLENLSQLHQELDTGDESYLLGFSVLDRNGTIVVDTHPESGNISYLGANWTDRSIFRQPILIGLPYSSQVEIPEQGELSSIYFAAQIKNELDHPLGVLIVHYNGK